MIPPLLPPSDLVDILHSGRRPLLVAHLAPDGDAIGSALALGLALRDLGQQPLLACQDRVPINLRFLPGADEFTNEVHGNDDVDLVIVLDSSDPSRMGNVFQAKVLGDRQRIIIDHHITNVHFGHWNWVEPSASSTSEMVFFLARALGAPLTRDMATCILTGLVTDTRAFQTRNTTPRSLLVASELVAAGAPLHEITERTLNTRSSDVIRLWGRVLDSFSLENGIAMVSNTVAMRRDLGGIVRAEGLVSFILGAPEAQVAVAFTEMPDKTVECSMRARPGYDVATVAFEFGGGGHPLAAGCTIAGDLTRVRQRVLARLQSVVRRDGTILT